ncbi:MAG: hypothetical protein KTR20_08060 [Cellvibrionaceae bacterium]|nr:hypothetical protein [Cellvibrionaceae bacterium]
MNNENDADHNAYILENQLEEARYAAEADAIDTEERSRQAERYAEGVEAAIDDLHAYSQTQNVTLDTRGDLWHADGALTHQPHQGQSQLSVADGLAITAVLTGGAIKNAYENAVDTYQTQRENAQDTTADKDESYS